MKHRRANYVQRECDLRFLSNVLLHNVMNTKERKSGGKYKQRHSRCLHVEVTPSQRRRETAQPVTPSSKKPHAGKTRPRRSLEDGPARRKKKPIAHRLLWIVHDRAMMPLTMAPAKRFFFAECSAHRDDCGSLANPRLSGPVTELA